VEDYFMKKILLAASIMLIVIFSCFAANPESDFEVDLTPDETGVMVISYLGTSSVIDIPEEIEGFPVVQIGRAEDWGGGTRFVGYSKKSFTITVPKTVKIIEKDAFAGCKGTINVDFSNLTYIGDTAFNNSDLSGKVVITKDCKLGHSVFASSKIEEIVFEEGITQIGIMEGDVLCASCINLKSVTFPSTLTIVTGLLFSNDKALTEVNIPDGTEIYWEDSRTFELCSALPLKVKSKIKSSGYTGNF
jgi:hypothetical protein